MVSELSALHIFVVGGEMRKGTDQIAASSLGAVLSRDEKAGGYKVERIYHPDPDYPENLSPLAKPGIDVLEGDDDRNRSMVRSFSRSPIPRSCSAIARDGRC